MEYDFKKQIQQKEHKEAVKLCLLYEQNLGFDIVDVSENPLFFEEGADLIRKEPQGEVKIDVKCLLNTNLYVTPCVPVEMLEIVGFNGNIKYGWLFSKLDYIYYVIWQTKELYPIKRTDLLVKTYSNAWRGFAAWHPNQKYFTLGVMIPIIALNINPIKL